MVIMLLMNKTLLIIFDTMARTATFFLLFIVAFNIVTRQLHTISSGSISFMIPGAIELSKYTLLIIIFSALPRAVTYGMVRVDLISNKLPAFIANTLENIWLVLMAGFTMILTIQFSQRFWLTFNRGDVSQDLQIPLYYFYAFISIACLATFIICLIKSFQSNPKQQEAE